MVQMVEFLVEIMIQRVPFGGHVVDSAASNRVRCKNVLGPRTSQRESTVICTNLSPMCGNRHSGDRREPKICRRRERGRNEKGRGRRRKMKGGLERERISVTLALQATNESIKDCKATTSLIEAPRSPTIGTRVA